MASVKGSSFLYRHSDGVGFALGTVILLSGLSALANAAGDTTSSTGVQFDDKDIKIAICQLVEFQEGAFGALIMVVAGIGAIVSSAFGAYRAATSLIVVACGSFILRALITLFFGAEVFEGTDCYADTVRLPVSNAGGTPGTGSSVPR